MAIKRAKRDPSGIEIVIFLKKLQNFSKKSRITSGGWKPHPQTPSVIRLSYMSFFTASPQ